MQPMLTFYLDLCCLNRPFDEQHQPRVRLEAEAVLGLIHLAILGELRWVTSDALELESSRNSDADRRAEVDMLMGTATSRVNVGPQETQRSRELQALGFKAFDALHIACAERASVDALLTTDERLWRRAQREAGKLAVRVENPAKWFPEAIAP
jgi:predicted nucleic acid-binding protein